MTETLQWLLSGTVTHGKVHNNAVNGTFIHIISVLLSKSKVFFLKLKLTNSNRKILTSNFKSLNKKHSVCAHVAVTFSVAPMTCRKVNGS